MRLSASFVLFAALVSNGCSEAAPSKSQQLSDALAAQSDGGTRARTRFGKRYEPVPVPGSFPLMAVLAGQGAGAIRIGANVAQVERLMQRPCDVRSEHLCRYVQRGIDFNLVGGITQSIFIQRKGRPAGKNADGEELEFGFFQGMIPPDLRLGMTPEAIQQYLGKPERAEHVAGPNPQTTVWRHYYPGLVLEYDWVAETRKLILGGIRIVKDPRVLPPWMSAADAGAPKGDAGAPVDAGAAPSDAGARKSDAGAPPVKQPEPR
jgi:hypothetical protein